MSRLLHPHCVSVIDFGVEGSPYLVMDFVTGRTLRDVMNEGRLPTARAMHFGAAAAGRSRPRARAGDRAPRPQAREPDPERGGGAEGAPAHPRLRAGEAARRTADDRGHGGRNAELHVAGAVGRGGRDRRAHRPLHGGHRAVRDADRAQAVPVGERRRGDPHAARDAAAQAARAWRPEAGYSIELEALLDKAMSKVAEDRFQSAAELAAALAGDAGREGGRSGHQRGQGRCQTGGAAKPTAAKKQNDPEKEKAKPVGPRPTVRQNAKTTIDTVSAVRRRLEGMAAGGRAGLGSSGWPGSARCSSWSRCWRC